MVPGLAGDNRVIQATPWARAFTLRTRRTTLVKTRVTFRVSDPPYGTTIIVEVFDFLGGEADGIGMAVAGMPAFRVGDRRVVFAHRQSSINPIVGFAQGLLQVRRDTNGIDRVHAYVEWRRHGK